jgi:hypothetical protein
MRGDTGTCDACQLPVYRSRDGEWHHNATWEQVLAAAREKEIKPIHEVVPI